MSPGPAARTSPSSSRRSVGAAALGCALALAGCSGDGEVDAPAGTTSGSSTVATSTPSASLSPGEPLDPPTEASQPPSAEPTTVAPEVESTADRSEAPPDELVRVLAVGLTESDGRTQIVIDTEGGTPGYRLRYVDAVRIDGEPLLVDGTVFLELVLQSADPAGEQGLDDDVAIDISPEAGPIEQIQLAYYLGSELTYAIGLAEASPFSVETTDDRITITFSG